MTREADAYLAVVARVKVGLWGSSSTMVRAYDRMSLPAPGPLTRQSGVDALNTALEVLLFAAAMNMGQGWLTVLALFGCMSCGFYLMCWTNATKGILTFYVQTWEEYHTHTLTLGLVSGPVEGIATLCIVFALTAYLGGGSFWQQPFCQTLGIPKHDLIPDVVYEMPWNVGFMYYAGLILLFNTVQRQASPPSFQGNLLTAGKAR